MNAPTVFRCDGDERVGAGHVARCLKIAAAFRMAGLPVLFVGRYGGIAGRLIAASGVATASPPDTPAGVPAGATAAVVDSYEIPDAELSDLVRHMPVAALCDGERAPGVTAVLSYRLDAGSIQLPSGAVGLLGADYAPVDPALLLARRPRGFERVLVTMGASDVGKRAAVDTVTELMVLNDVEIFVAGVDGLPVGLKTDGRVHAAVETGLRERVHWADVAVAAGGTTAYDLACAGVPAVLRAIAPNQRPFARTFAVAGIALTAGDDDASLAEAISDLADHDTRDRLALTGPSVVDGYGAFRARDALLATFAGRPVPQPLRYRPARPSDAESILGWRNEPAVRAASRTTDPVPQETHERWLAARLERPAEPFLVIEDDRSAVGVVRFDRDGPSAEISITLDHSRRGHGTGTRAIREACELVFASDQTLKTTRASVRRGNLASERAFASAGFTIAGRSEEWLDLCLERRRLEGDPAPRGDV